MADYTVTASSVSGSGGSRKWYKAGEALDAGMPVYQHTDNRAYKALNDTAAHAAVVGIALNSADAQDQYVQVQAGGSITTGANSFTNKAETVYLSGTAGGMCPEADLTSSTYVTLIGLSGAADNVLNVNITATGLLDEAAEAS